MSGPISEAELAQVVEDANDVQKRYQDVADEADESFFQDNALPSRAPYRRNVDMGRGAHYYEGFKEFLTNGGLGFYKNAVVMNIRMNYVGSLDMIDESFKAEFFLDLAYWVPRFDRAHHNDPSTIGTFAQFEPRFDFPEFLESAFVTRETEFSRDPHSRQHECQLGQNAETLLQDASKGPKKAKGPLGDAMFTSPPRALQGWLAGDDLHLVAERPVVKLYARVGDKRSHWPRLWRTLVSDAELKDISNLKHQKKNSEAKALVPSNGKPENMHKSLKELFELLDAKREKHLLHPEEGVVFVTYDVTCSVRQSFSLQKFPYDFQELVLTVRLYKDHMDPFTRHIVPVAHDKAFFCSGRVPELTEWDLTKNLDWAVERGTQGDSARDGGKERLVAKIIVARKHYFYTTHYVLIIFLMTTSVFCAFSFDAAQQLEARTGVIFNLLLTVVAFQYSCSDNVPKTPYPTVLDNFININFLCIIIVGAAICLFSWLAYDDERAGRTHTSDDQDNYPSHPSRLNALYSRNMETAIGSTLAGIWVFGNFYYWMGVADMFLTTMKHVEEDEQLGWMKFRHTKRPVWDRDIRDE